MSNCEARSWRLLKPRQKKAILSRLDDTSLDLIGHNTVSGGPLDKHGNPTPWWSKARPNQLPPESLWDLHLIWAILAGRGWGKTRAAAEWVRALVVERPGSRGAFVAKDPGEARDVMIEGQSGILAISHKSERPHYQPSIKRLTWPNGAQASIYSSEDYEELRGPQHGWAWCDELPKWRHAAQTWEQLMLGLRLGVRPLVCVSSTPRPVKVLKEILADPMTVITRGRTRDNLDNLSTYYTSLIGKYEGTRFGRQELDAELLDDIPGSLWSYAIIDDNRVSEVPDMRRIVVALDPGTTEDGDMTGIVVAGKGVDGRGYVLADRSILGRPEVWARHAVDTYRLMRADCIIAERNNGGEMIEATLRQFDRTVPVRLVWASRGKIARAEPIALLYERGLISHAGAFPDLEDEMCSYSEAQIGPKMASPNRMDAMVWAFTDLFERGEANFGDVVLGPLLQSAGGSQF